MIFSYWRWLALIIFTPVMLGCAYDERMSALPDTLHYLWSRPPNVDTHSLDPHQRYLRVTHDQQVALMVLGYRTAAADGAVDTWYSAKGEVLKLKNGRIIETDGLDTDWRQVHLPVLPSWRNLEDHSLTYLRQRDVMPGYRYGVSERITVQPIPQPSLTQIKHTDPAHLRWFEERATPLSPNTPSLPPTVIAVDTQNGVWHAVYGEQSLAPDYRLTWQRWPAP